jgi:outer membrane protein assembly factor BamB
LLIPRIWKSEYCSVHPRPGNTERNRCIRDSFCDNRPKPATVTLRDAPMIRLFSFALLALALTLTLSPAADWSRFRGPNGSGIAEGQLPKLDPKAPLWKVEIPGKGVSSPIVVGGKIYLQTASKDGKTRTLLCLNEADGTTVWTKDVAGTTASTHAKNSLASSTPACDGETIYCVWWDGSGVALHAYDLKGNEKWRTSLGGYVSQHGPGFSPVVHGGLVFVNVDDDERAELVAIDIKTGDKKWVKERKHVRASYSSPFIVKRGDKPEEVILGTTSAITSYEPATGKVNWDYVVPWPAGKMQLRVIGQPIYAGGLFIMSCGDGSGSRYMIAVDVERKMPAKVWDTDRDSLPYVPCILVKGDLLFWIGDKVGGQAVCAEAKTGKILFNERITTKEPSASPIMVGDQILMIAENGDMVVFTADKEFDQVSKVNLGEGVFATPAVADGKLFIRGTSHLFCFGKK